MILRNPFKVNRKSRLRYVIVYGVLDPEPGKSGERVHSKQLL